jgi:hypothetical protein
MEGGFLGSVFIHPSLIWFIRFRLEFNEQNMEKAVLKTNTEQKSKGITIIQWLTTGNKNIRIGLASPTDKTTVHKSPIETLGQVVGLPDNHYRIQAFITTNKEYEQGFFNNRQYGFLEDQCNLFRCNYEPLIF